MIPTFGFSRQIPFSKREATYSSHVVTTVVFYVKVTAAVGVRSLSEHKTEAGDPHHCG